LGVNEGRRFPDFCLQKILPMKPESEIMDEHLRFCNLYDEFTPQMRKRLSRTLFFRMMVLGVRWDELKTTGLHLWIIFITITALLFNFILSHV